MADVLKVGDTVYLNSGSPPLQIDLIENGRATCSWVHKGERRQIEAPVGCFKPAP